MCERNCVANDQLIPVVVMLLGDTKREINTMHPTCCIQLYRPTAEEFDVRIAPVRGPVEKTLNQIGNRQSFVYICAMCTARNVPGSHCNGQTQ